MLPDRVSNPGPLTYESGALPIALRGPAFIPWIWESTFAGNNLFPQRGQILTCKCTITRSESKM